MLRISETFKLMTVQIVITLATLAFIGCVTSVQASPMCATTIVLPGGQGTMLASRIADGVCVQSEDKLYGAFNLGNLGQAESITFGSVTVGGVVMVRWSFIDELTPASTPARYELEVLEGGPFPRNNFITQLPGGIPLPDGITQTTGGPTTLTETTNPSPNSGSINSSNTIVSGGTFIDNDTTTMGISDPTASGALSIGPGHDASAIRNTLIDSQQLATTLEPSTVELLGVALIAFALVFYLKSISGSGKVSGDRPRDAQPTSTSIHG